MFGNTENAFLVCCKLLHFFLYAVVSGKLVKNRDPTKITMHACMI